MSILEGIKTKALTLLDIAEPYLPRSTASYDASLNRVIVAGFPLDGIVTYTISADTIMRQETGIDYYYNGITEVITERTLTVTVLPTSKCLSVLRLLALRQLETKGWFNIAVHENNSIVNVYRAFILEMPEIATSQETADRQIVFAIKTMHSGFTAVDDSTNTEDDIFKEYSIRPEDSNIEKNIIINERTNGVTQTSEGVDSYIEGYEPNN
jgi:hypothetical protein